MIGSVSNRFSFISESTNPWCFWWMSINFEKYPAGRLLKNQVRRRTCLKCVRNSGKMVWGDLSPSYEVQIIAAWRWRASLEEEKDGLEGGTDSWIQHTCLNFESQKLRCHCPVNCIRFNHNLPIRWSAFYAALQANSKHGFQIRTVIWMALVFYTIDS